MSAEKGLAEYPPGPPWRNTHMSNALESGCCLDSCWWHIHAAAWIFANGFAVGVADAVG